MEVLVFLGSSMQGYDLRLAALAVCVCAGGCFTSTTLMARSKADPSQSPIPWLLAAAVVFGCSVWSLHFVAMLAFMPEVASYDPALTVLSITVAIAGSLLALMAWRLLPTGWARSIPSGLLLGLAVAGMHYIGMSAMRLAAPAVLDRATVAMSLVVCLGCAVVAMLRSESLATVGRRVEVAAWLAVSILGVHCIGMSALQIAPGAEVGPVQAPLGSGGFAAAVSTVSLAVLGASLIASLMQRRLSRQALDELGRMRVLSDVAQEGIIIHHAGEVLEVNSAGSRLLDRPVETMIGKPMLSLFASKNTASLLRRLQCPPEELVPEEVEIETRDGRPMPLELSCRPVTFQGKPATAIALRDLSDQKRNEVRIRHLAHHDALTDLPNRFLLQERLSHALSLAAQNGTRVALLYLDLDRFKPVNDLLGHAGGDALLVEVARRLAGEIRSEDTLARVGGDEFIVVQSNSHSVEKVSSLVSRVIERVGQPFDIEGRPVDVGVSIGIALYPTDGTTPDALLRAADMAMYRVKEERRGSWRFFDASMDAALHERTMLEQDLRHAVERDELVLFYQPLVDCKTAEVTAFETLMRWRHPTRGLVPPSDFVPVAEEAGIIGQLGRWAMERACRTAVAWPKSWRVTVNVSPVQFRMVNFASMVADILAQTGLDPSRLELEITEGIFIDDAARAVGVLTSLRALGVRVSLDDFGTGFSSLSYLRLFHFDKIKIDQSFVKEIGRSAEANTIVKAIVNLGHNLGLSVTAEGVETPEQLTHLQALGSDHLQGFLLGQPTPDAALSVQEVARLHAMLVGPTVASAR